MLDLLRVNVAGSEVCISVGILSISCKVHSHTLQKSSKLVSTTFDYPLHILDLLPQLL